MQVVVGTPSDSHDSVTVRHHYFIRKLDAEDNGLKSHNVKLFFFLTDIYMKGLKKTISAPRGESNLLSLKAKVGNVIC